MPRHPPYALINLYYCLLIRVQIFFPSVRLKILFFSRSFKKDHVINIQFSKIIFSFQKSYDSWKLNRNLTSVSLFRYATFRSVFLLRKEVIHPHVPVGIPCYDLTPIISPTLGARLLCRLPPRLRVLPTLMVWRAVCTNPGNVFTVTCWFTITSDSVFMKSSCRLQSELRLLFWVSLHLAVLHPFVTAIVARV